METLHNLEYWGTYIEPCLSAVVPLHMGHVWWAGFHLLNWQVNWWTHGGIISPWNVSSLSSTTVSRLWHVGKHSRQPIRRVQWFPLRLFMRGRLRRCLVCGVKESGKARGFYSSASLANWWGNGLGASRHASDRKYTRAGSDVMGARRISCRS